MNLFGAREIILNRVALVAAGRLAALAAVVLGPLGPDENAAVLFLVTAGLAAAWSAAEALWTRKDVTPVVDPRTETGVPLVPATGATGPGAQGEGVYLD